MDEPRLTSDRADAIISLLRDNPGVSMTLPDIGDATDLPVDELAVHLEDLVEREVLEKETMVDGYDVFRFPADYQRGSMAP